MQKPPILKPRAPKMEKKLTAHGDERLDLYYGMRERENPAVLQYLNEENAYLKQGMAHTENLQQQLFEEIKGRIKQDDASVPYFKNGYWYYVRFEMGSEHPIYCRKKESLEAPEQILINANEEAQNFDYFKIGGLSISPDNKWLAYGIDTVGRRIYRICFKQIHTGERWDTELENTTGTAVWSKQGDYVFYTQKDESLRPYRIMRHSVGSYAAHDEVIFTERDATYVCGVGKTKSEEYLVIASHSTVSDEYRVCAAHTPTDDFAVFEPRQRHLEYNLAHYGEHWYIVTNKNGATNFKLMCCGLRHTGQAHWEEVLPHRPEVLLEDVEIFKRCMVLQERAEGLTRLRIRSWDGAEDYYLQWNEETYLAGIGNNPAFDSPYLRYSYTSLTTPGSVYDYHFETGEHYLQKQQEVIGGHDPEKYVSERIWAEAPDGVRVPISLVYQRDKISAEGNPVLLYGYGSYGITVPPGFSVARLSLLQRGFVFAIAHIRGGQYLGRHWYEAGKLLQKRNTFTDFIACAERLKQEHFCNPEQLLAMGGSAGGLLVGAVLNMRPDLFKAAIAAVPFVDVVTTMLDESIPLTTGEFDEWGNPAEEEYYYYIKSYSPYDNVQPQDYPALLVTTGLHDSQVQYWEPAKWVAKLRELKTDDCPLYLHTIMEAGHGGKSGRFESLREVALEYAFLINNCGAGE